MVKSPRLNEALQALSGNAYFSMVVAHLEEVVAENVKTVCYAEEKDLATERGRLRANVELYKLLSGENKWVHHYQSKYKNK